MAIYVYNTTTGALVSWCPNDTDPVASGTVLAAAGLTAVSGLAPLDSIHAWNTSTKTVQVVAAPTPVNLVATFDFIMAFTPAELAAIRASANTSIAQFLFAMQVTQGLNLNATSISNSLNFLVAQSLLTAPRAAVILATVISGTARGIQ